MIIRVKLENTETTAANSPDKAGTAGYLYNHVIEAGFRLDRV